MAQTIYFTQNRGETGVVKVYIVNNKNEQGVVEVTPVNSPSSAQIKGFIVSNKVEAQMKIALKK